MQIGIITGVTGQDGSYLAELLLEKGYTVVGLVRRTSSKNTSRISHILDNPKFSLEEYDMTDAMSNNKIINKYTDFDCIEIYNLAAQSHVQTSFDQPWYTFQVNACSVYGWLECIRQCSFSHKIKFYQAGTSEMFGKVQEIPQKETTQFYPRSPYGVSKVAAFWACKNYRESYGLFICNGILFNHESERRGENFVTRKITLGLGSGSCIPLGNLDAKRDWGHARDYVRGMWMMMQHEIADDYVLATGETHSIREFINEAVIDEPAAHWIDDSLYIGFKHATRVDPKFLRPCEVELLVGDASKARDVLGWVPEVSFKELVKTMMLNDKQ